jgi:hypothetical protein
MSKIEAEDTKVASAKPFETGRGQITDSKLNNFWTLWLGAQPMR